MTHDNQLPYQPQQLAMLFQSQRRWFDAIFAPIDETDLMWEVPHTPYTIDWVLWHLANSCHYVPEVRLVPNGSQNTYSGYPPYELGAETLTVRIATFKTEHQAFEHKVRALSPEFMGSMKTYFTASGQRTESLGQIVVEQLYHLAGHITVCRYIHNQRERVEGHPQKWPHFR